MGFYSFIPFYAVVKFGLTPFESAAVLTPRAIVVMATSAVASLYVKRLGYRVPMLLGMVFVGATFVLMAQGWSGMNLGFVVGPGLLAAGHHHLDRRLRDGSGQPGVEQRGDRPGARQGGVDHGYPRRVPPGRWDDQHLGAWCWRCRFSRIRPPGWT